jgi:hypothetical protein
LKLPKNPSNALKNHEKSQDNTQNVSTNHIEIIFSSPNDVKINPPISVTEKKDQSQCDLDFIQKTKK